MHIVLLCSTKCTCMISYKSYNITTMNDEKLQHLLSLVIDQYIGKWEPIWSKFLNSLDDIDYAPSTLRKYLNVLEKEWLLYQPYNSSWRVPTLMWMSNYMDALLNLTEEEMKNDEQFDLNYARKDLRSIVEMLGKIVDWAAVWFLKEDEYYALWIHNLVKESLMWDYELSRHIIKFVESKDIVQTLDAKLMKRWEVYYTILEQEEKIISIVYWKLEVNWYDSVICIIWPSRIDHKRNVWILKKLFDQSNS